MGRETRFDPVEDEADSAAAHARAAFAEMGAAPLPPLRGSVAPLWLTLAALGWASLATFLAVGLGFEANAARDDAAAYRSLARENRRWGVECESRSLDFQWRADRCEALERASLPADRADGRSFISASGYSVGKTSPGAPAEREFAVTFSSGPEAAVSIDQDGNVELGPDAKPDEAARLFWEAVTRTMPECAKGRP